LLKRKHAHYVKVEDGIGTYNHLILREKKVIRKGPIDLFKLQETTSENITSILLKKIHRASARRISDKSWAYAKGIVNGEICDEPRFDHKTSHGFRID